MALTALILEFLEFWDTGYQIHDKAAANALPGEPTGISGIGSHSGNSWVDRIFKYAQMDMNNVVQKFLSKTT